MNDPVLEDDCMDIIQKCMQGDTIICSFVIPDNLIDEFERIVRDRNTNTCNVLNQLIRHWIKQNGTR